MAQDRKLDEDAFLVDDALVQEKRVEKDAKGSVGLLRYYK